jgi:hypothetical protein
MFPQFLTARASLIRKSVEGYVILPDFPFWAGCVKVGLQSLAKRPQT